MGQIDMVGSKMDIGGGNTEKMDTFTGGTIQSFAGDAPLSRTNSPLGVFTDQPMGQMQMMGEEVPLKRAAHRGYESGTPINAQTDLPESKQSF